MKILRPPEVYAKTGMGKSKFDDDFIKTGKLRWLRLGRRSKGLPEHELDAVIAQMIADRDASPPVPPEPAVPRKRAA